MRDARGILTIGVRSLKNEGADVLFTERRQVVCWRSDTGTGFIN